MAYRKSSIPNLKAKLHVVRQMTVSFANTQLRAFADQECQGFKDQIRDQDFVAFHRRPLSPARLAEKAAAGADLRVMIATQHYVNSIRVFFRKGRGLNLRGQQFRIGFHHLAHARNLEGEIEPILLRDVAWIQEHGSRKRKIPPRPHWGPYLQEMRVRATVFRAALVPKMIKHLKAKLAKVH